MTLLLSLTLIVFGASWIRRLGGVGVPDMIERTFLLGAPLPLILSLAVPAGIGLACGFGGECAVWMRRVSWSGVRLSIPLLLVGAVLIVRARKSGRPWGWPLGSAVIVAAAPAIIVSIAYLLLSTLSVVLPALLRISRQP
jgi:hypothetical protein